MQLTYGDDSLDPVSMEGKDGSPIDFVRTLSQIKAATPHDDAPGLQFGNAVCMPVWDILMGHTGWHHSCTDSKQSCLAS